MKNLCIFLWLFGIAGQAAAQNTKAADSLLRVLAATGRDTNRVNLLNRLAREYRATDQPKARGYLRESVSLARELHFTQGEAGAYNIFALTYDYEGNYPEALGYFNKALQLAGRSGNPGGTARILDNQGDLYRRMGQYDSAVSTLKRSLQIKQRLADKKGTALTHEIIGSVYTTTGHYVTALDHYLNALRITETLGDREMLGNSYIHTAIICGQLNDYKEALDYYAKGLNIKKETGNTESLLAIYLNRSMLYLNTGSTREALADIREAQQILGQSNNAAALTVCYTNAGTIYKTMREYDKAADYYKRALELALETGDIYSQATLYNSLGEIAGRQRKFGEALAYLKKGNAHSTTAGTLEYLKENYLAYSDVYAAMNDPKNAYTYRLRYEQIKDSITNDHNNKQIADMRERYETGKKELEIVQLRSREKEQQLNIAGQKLQIQQRNFMLAGITGGFLLLAVAGGFSYSRYRVQQNARLDKALAAQERIRMETILETEQSERLRIAKDLHDELGSGISKIMLCNELAKKHINGNESLNHTLHTIDKTIGALAGNMNDLIWSLQVEHATADNLFAKMREFASDFFDESPIEPEFDLRVENAAAVLSKELLRDVFLVYKEALNNAMKYSGADRIKIAATVHENKLDVTLQDNGVGMDGTNPKTGGNGIHNMRNRIGKHRGSFDITGDKTGTKVHFSVDIHPAHIMTAGTGSEGRKPVVLN